MNKPRLTPRQREIMEFVDQVNVSGTYENKDGRAYVECGKYKPFSQRAFDTLLEKKLVKHHDPNYIVYGAYFLVPMMGWRSQTK